jgi:hemolysin activation/secretion protein
MKYFFAVLFQVVVFCLCSLLVYAAPPEKKREKQKQQNEQREEIIMPVDIDIPEGKTQKEIDEENAMQLNQKWERYLTERIDKMQQFFNDISQLDSNSITKERIEEYRIEVNNLKEKVDFKLGNDPLWKENDELDEMRALFSETHARTLTKLKYWDDKIDAQKTKDSWLWPKRNRWLIPCIVAFGVIALILIKIKTVVEIKNAKKEAKKLRQQQQQEAEKQKLLADENNIINIQ